MYESYWGLKVRPFDRRADAAFYYPAENQHAALVKLRYAFEHGSAAALAGAAGTGKTLLLDLLAGQLESQGRIFVRLAFPLLSPAEMLGYLADELAGEESPSVNSTPPIDQSLRRMEGSLTKLAAQNKRLVVVIDEAHAIDDLRTWEALRLLMNLETANQPPPIVVLVGQTSLLQMLSRMPSLEERLSAKCLLPAFSAEETAAYIVHRLQAAGAGREIFNGSAMEAVHALGQGVPRRINRLCDLALLVGYAEERQTIATEQIEAVAEDLTGAGTPRDQATHSM
ncbi:MAG: AAA family ATPase [Pirellulales bacterium]